MTNRILRVQLFDRQVLPSQAELQVVVQLQHHDPTAQVRGRVLGPRCRFASTVEVAYPLRPTLQASVPTERINRVLIPEPSFWDPQSPHLYLALVELWQEGLRLDSVQLRHAFKHVVVRAGRLFLNGRALALRCRQVEDLSEQQALALRAAGYNALVVPLRESTRTVWEIADRIGFLVLGRLPSLAAEVKPFEDLLGHPSWLDWLPPDEYRGIHLGQLSELVVDPD